VRRARSGTAVAALLLLAGCSGSSTPATTPQTITLTEQEQRGKQLFVSNCGPCHSLADADTHGSAGPGLDDHPWRTVTVREVIASGPGLMPAELVTGADADAVAAYVAAATRR
jgi:mono/diheme cytochrome c family protein